MELRHLRYFVAVAEELSFARAGARLKIAPPPLHVQIRNLEREIGTPLFERVGRGIRLTEPGRILLDQARLTLAQAQRSIALARQASEGEIGNLSIGYIPSAEFQLFPRIIPAFRKAFPQVHLSFHSMKGGSQIDALRRDEIDVGLLWLPVPVDGFDAEQVLEDPLIVALPAEHSLAVKSSISIKELAAEPLILASRTLAPETFYQFDQLFQRAGAVMNVAYELDNSLSILNFVAMGFGCSIVPEYARALRQEGIVYRRLRPAMTRKLGIVKKKGRGGIAKLFVRFTLDDLGSAAAPTSR